MAGDSLVVLAFGTGLSIVALIIVVLVAIVILKFVF
jgi:hypothetical protein